MNPDFVIDHSAVEEIIKNLAEKLNAYYVFPDIAGEICVRLEKHLQDGIYDDITEGEFLALALTTPMQEISQDKHLWVRWYPEPMPDHEGSLLKNREKVEELKRKARHWLLCSLIAGCGLAADVSAATLKAVVRDMADYDRLYQQLIKADLFDVSASFVMEEIKRTTELPL